MNVNDFTLFYKNVICNSPFYNTSLPYKNLDLLFPDFRNKLISCINQFKNKYPDIPVSIGETYRGIKLQEQYYKSGASKTLNSMHRLGLAADIDIPLKYYPELRNIFKKNGLTILGSWDLRHVQYIPVNAQGRSWEAVNNICKSNITSEDNKTHKKFEASINPIFIILALGLIVTLILKKNI